MLESGEGPVDETCTIVSRQPAESDIRRAAFAVSEDLQPEIGTRLQELLSITNGGCSGPWSFALQMLDNEVDQGDHNREDVFGKLLLFFKAVMQSAYEDES